VHRLALLGSGGHGTMRRMTVEMVNWKAVATRAEERAALTHNLGALMLHGAESIDALAFEIHDISCHGTRFRSRDVSVASGLQAAIDVYRNPLLLIWGEHDVTADARPLLAQLLEGHPNREGAVIDGGGHWVQFERADEVNARLLAFFA
jgi:pimeloyl-ACP methyl ester carboxylesterase